MIEISHLPVSKEVQKFKKERWHLSYASVPQSDQNLTFMICLFFLFSFQEVNFYTVQPSLG